jgi:hypothetical protein
VSTVTLEEPRDDGRTDVFRDVEITWKAKRETPPIPYEHGLKDGADEGAESYLRGLFALDEALATLDDLEARFPEGSHTLNSEPLPLESGCESLQSLQCGGAWDDVEHDVGDLTVWGAFSRRGSWAGYRRDGTLYRPVELDLPEDLAERLASEPNPADYIRALQSIADEVGALTNHNAVGRVTGSRLPF